MHACSRRRRSLLPRAEQARASHVGSWPRGAPGAAEGALASPTTREQLVPCLRALACALDFNCRWTVVSLGPLRPWPWPWGTSLRPVSFYFQFLLLFIYGPLPFSRTKSQRNFCIRARPASLATATGAFGSAINSWVLGGQAPHCQPDVSKPLVVGSTQAKL